MRKILVLLIILLCLLVCLGLLIFLLTSGGDTPSHSGPDYHQHKTTNVPQVNLPTPTFLKIGVTSKSKPALSNSLFEFERIVKYGISIPFFYLTSILAEYWGS